MGDKAERDGTGICGRETAERQSRETELGYRTGLGDKAEGDGTGRQGWGTEQGDRAGIVRQARRTDAGGTVGEALFQLMTASAPIVRMNPLGRAVRCIVPAGRRQSVGNISSWRRACRPRSAARRWISGHSVIAPSHRAAVSQSGAPLSHQSVGRTRSSVTSRSASRRRPPAARRLRGILSVSRPGRPASPHPPTSAPCRLPSPVSASPVSAGPRSPVGSRRGSSDTIAAPAAPQSAESGDISAACAPRGRVSRRRHSSDTAAIPPL